MKNSPFSPAAGYVRAIRPRSLRACSALLAGFISLSLPVAISRAQPSSYEADGEEVLTRGPVHEAFAAVVSYNPAPGIVVKTRPPELIEELPPEERPEGEDVAWIPGYWGWDDERNDYLWISGTWRILPPGREWMAGYWRETDDGYQWISGYWADATERETTYLPPPPASLEVGANLDAPSDDYGWSPGCWIWREDRYAWRVGYWAEGRADWVWIPAYYAWTPRGVIFVEGFWDYPVERRGILFAPVYYQSRGYARRGYSYSPRIAINLSLFLDNLFLRPSYHHYYFGDYYGSRYEQDGFYASISFSSSRQGFDPFYSYSRWENRSDRDWDRRFRASYQDRRDHETTRPPRTWAAQVSVNASIAVGGSVRLQLAVPLAQLARSPDHPVRFQPVAQGDRQQLAQRGREVQQSRDQRRTVEAKAVVTKGRSASVAVEPVRVAAPRTPIVAKPAGQRGRNATPPQDQQAPRPNSPAPQPKAENAGRPQNADRRNAPAETRQPEPRRNSPEDQRPNESTRKTAPEAQRQAEPDADRRARAEQQKAQAVEKSRQQDEERANASARQKRDETQQRANESAARDKQQSEDRRNVADEKARDESQRKNQEAQQQSRQENDQRNRDEQQKVQAAERSRQQDDERTSNSARKAREETQQKANEPAPRAPQNEDRANVPAAKAREAAPRPAPEARGKQPDDPRRAKEESGRSKPAPKDKAADDEDDDSKKEKPRGK